MLQGGDAYMNKPRLGLPMAPTGAPTRSKALLEGQSDREGWCARGCRLAARVACDVNACTAAAARAVESAWKGCAYMQQEGSVSMLQQARGYRSVVPTSEKWQRERRRER